MYPLFCLYRDFPRKRTYRKSLLIISTIFFHLVEEIYANFINIIMIQKIYGKFNRIINRRVVL